MSTVQPASVDLDAYFSRTGYAGERQATAEALAEIHLAHAISIPFENLAVLAGEPILLDLGSLQEKLVRRRRGGYCYEQNTLLAAVLEALGFAVTPLAARVRLGACGVRPRTHMLLRVEAEGQSWIADVGFGAGGPILPVPLREGEEHRQHAWSYRLAREEDGCVMQALRQGDWLDLYAFTLERQYPVDFELCNYFVSTHPASPFTQIVTTQRSGPDVRYVLRGSELIVERSEALTREPLNGEAGVRRVLAEVFELEVPEGPPLGRL